VNQGSKVEGELENCILDEIRIYIDGLLTHATAGPITIAPFEYKIFGPFVADPLLKGLDLLTCEEYEEDILLECSIYTYEIYVTIKEDVNLDFKVDMIDIRAAAKAFGSYPEHPRWDARWDINEDFLIDMRDIRGISKRFGWCHRGQHQPTVNFPHFLVPNVSYTLSYRYSARVRSCS